MKSLFSGITSLSLRFRAVTLALVILLSVAGVVAITQLKQELLPSISFPQTIILAQATGMTSDQVLQVLTERLEQAIDGVDEVVNVESSTTGAFGAVITARNNFGVSQDTVRDRIQQAVDSVWLPTRRISAPEGETPADFAARLLADLPADVLIYLQQNDSGFLFQLSPQVWSALSADTVQTVLAYLANQTTDTTGTDALRLLVEQEIVPALENIEQVASINVSGGQILPSDDAAPTPVPVENAEPISRLLDLSPEVWAVVSAKVDGLGAQDQSAVELLNAVPFTIPEGVPALPASWMMDRFKDARDLREMRTLTRTIGAVFNQFIETGVIVGALGQTDDLTPADIDQMLAIEPSLVEYFEAEHLVSMSDDAFAALPAEFIAGLDGLTRDELAAKALATAISGEATQPAPVDLPQPWRVQPPQLITFSFDDLPLATFSISGTGEVIAAGEGEAVAAPVDETPVDAPEATPVVADVPEGPSLPLVFNLLGGFIGLELNTADDLINIQLPDDMAAQFGGTQTLSAADLLNFLLLLDNPDALPEGAPSVSIPGGATGVIRQLSPEVILFIAQYDDTFLPNLSAGVVEAFSTDVLLNVPGVEIPLSNVWNTLSNQSQFDGSVPLRTAQDVVEIGAGSPSNVLNTINASIPEQFAGYDVRLFDSLTPGVVRYFTAVEPDFYANLDPAVIAKFSPEVLADLPEDVIAALPADTAATVQAIASGEAQSAAEQLADLYATDVPPADPNAPALNADWQFIADFLGVELDTADDFFRFFPSASGFINNLFSSAQGAAFAPNLLGNTSADALAYMAQRDPEFLTNLRIEALQLLAPEVVATLPADVQERIASGAAPFVPTDALTRVNGNSSLAVTVYKSNDANSVEAYHIVEELLHRIDEENENITVGIAFEQASFIEESISGVAREGGLGAIFAVIVILIFLSSGTWSRRPRAVVGGIMIALFLGGLFLVVQSNLATANNDFGQAFDQTDVVVRVLLLLGAIIGFIVLIFPGKLPHPAWRSTLVTGVSIPLSVLMALAAMHWIPPIVHNALLPAADGSPLIGFLLRLFPESITLNIMTLSGLTVAIGRVVDDSIVVLENIFR
ncbi:MAG: efflux RND transporter permease subunit, partial [Anaerolinea sp.]|nr:efflux RND transporter permease subunit [Anaerolinea sp.]